MCRPCDALGGMPCVAQVDTAALDRGDDVTLGAWEAYYDEDAMCWCVRTPWQTTDGALMAQYIPDGPTARFIAHARNALPALSYRAEALDRELEYMREERSRLLAAIRATVSPEVRRDIMLLLAVRRR